MKIIRLFTLLVLLKFSGLVFAQDEIGSYISPNKPDKMEIKATKFSKAKSFYPAELDDKLKLAQETGNTAEEEKIIREMNLRIPVENRFISVFNEKDDRCLNIIKPPFNNHEWSMNDITVFSGQVKNSINNYRQIDMKMGEDGNIYVAINRSPATGNNGRIDVYRSSNGGANWILTNGVVSVKAYFGSVSLLVESNNNLVGDSTRIFVLYSRSANENNDNATIDYASWKRNGSGFYSAEIASPNAGREFAFVSAVSDGAFYSSATWVGMICVEAYNDLSIIQGYRFFRSVDWGISWTGVTFSSLNDYYPSAQLRPGSASSSDSVWYAVERRISSTRYEIRVFSTPWTPTVAATGYFLTAGGEGVKYQRPVLTVKQNRSCDSAMVTVTKNGASYYCPTFNGGGSWSADFTLGGITNGSNKSFTFCSSSPEGNNPVTAMWMSNDGDSINLRSPGKFGALGTSIYKRNSNLSSGFVSPVCIVYNPVATTDLNAFCYAGSASNVYANQENLNVGIIQNSSEMPENYSLSQNYPNPFNPETKINFNIPVFGYVSMNVFDITGKEVVSLVKSNLQPGSYTVNFNSSDLSGGVYFYKIVSGSFSNTKKMMLLK